MSNKLTDRRRTKCPVNSPDRRQDKMSSKFTERRRLNGRRKARSSTFTEKRKTKCRVNSPHFFSNYVENIHRETSHEIYRLFNVRRPINCGDGRSTRPDTISSILARDVRKKLRDNWLWNTRMNIIQHHRRQMSRYLFARCRITHRRCSPWDTRRKIGMFHRDMATQHRDILESPYKYWDYWSRSARSNCPRQVTASEKKKSP